jgi:hypothetical protein
MIIVKKYAKGGDIETPNGAFMKWYTNWLKKTIDNYEIYVFISIPNEISLPTLADVNGADNVVIIDHIEKIGNADVKKYMQEITDKADELGVIIYLMPVPRTHKLTEAHKKKITKDYLIGYYEKFGFKKHNDYMVRNPKMAMGGQMPNNTFVGKRIKLIAMNEEPNPVEPNTMGTIRLIDGIGQIHVDWDNGRSLAVVPEIDEYEIID